MLQLRLLERGVPVKISENEDRAQPMPWPGLAHQVAWMGSLTLPLEVSQHQVRTLAGCCCLNACWCS